MSRERATELITLINEPFKQEILDGIGDDIITIYTIGGEGALEPPPPPPEPAADDDKPSFAAPRNEWWDLCAGPHLEDTGQIPSNAFKVRRGAPAPDGRGEPSAVIGGDKSAPLAVARRPRHG